jgi:hypothetical protein
MVRGRRRGGGRSGAGYFTHLSTKGQNLYIIVKCNEARAWFFVENLRKSFKDIVR